jgi:hypothetical protein
MAMVWPGWAEEGRGLFASAAHRLLGVGGEIGLILLH